MNALVGHQEQKEKLLSMARDQALPTAFIFFGSQGIGKKQLVRGLLQVLNCQRDIQACGVCSHCVRALETKNEFVFEVGLDGKKNISVESIRELHKFLSLKTMNAARFVIIDPADQLSKAASNALLKVLEEPPAKTYFFLLTDKLSALLPTIRSRSQILRFSKLTEEQLKHVKDLSPTAMEWSGGRLDYAKQLLEENSINTLNESLQLFYKLICGEALDWKKEASWFFDDENEKDFCFHIWNQALEKRLHGQKNNLEWMPEDEAKLSYLFERLEDFKSDLNRNVDKLLAMENFYYSLRKDDKVSLWS